MIFLIGITCHDIKVLLGEILAPLKLCAFLRRAEHKHAATLEIVLDSSHQRVFVANYNKLDAVCFHKIIYCSKIGRAYGHISPVASCAAVTRGYVKVFT